MRETTAPPHPPSGLPRRAVVARAAWAAPAVTFAAAAPSSSASCADLGTRWLTTNVDVAFSTVPQLTNSDVTIDGVTWERATTTATVTNISDQHLSNLFMVVPVVGVNPVWNATSNYTPMSWNESSGQFEVPNSTVYSSELSASEPTPDSYVIKVVNPDNTPATRMALAPLGFWLDPVQVPTPPGWAGGPLLPANMTTPIYTLADLAPGASTTYTATLLKERGTGSPAVAARWWFKGTLTCAAPTTNASSPVDGRMTLRTSGISPEASGVGASGAGSA